MYKVNDSHNLRLIDFISYSGRMKTKPRPNSWSTTHCLCNFIITAGLHLGIKAQKPLFTNEEDLPITIACGTLGMDSAPESLTGPQAT